MGNFYFTSSDLALVAAILSKGYQIARIDRSNGQRVVFVICKDERLDSIVSDYFSHQLEIDALTFFNAIKSLKTRIYHT